MLSVQDPRARGTSRDRSRSRGRGEEAPRSHSRDIRGPSPARHAPPPQQQQQHQQQQQVVRKYYEPESDEDESEEDERHGGRRGGGGRYIEYGRDEDEYGDERGYGGGRREGGAERGYEARYEGRSGRRGDYPKEYERTRHGGGGGREDLAYGEYHAPAPASRGQHVPGAFDEEEERKPRAKVHHQERQPEPYSPERPPFAMNYMTTGGRPQYQVPPKYEYAPLPEQIKYLPKTDSGKKYHQTADAQIEVASSRRSKREEEAAKYVAAMKYEEEKRKYEEEKRKYMESIAKKKPPKDDYSDDEWPRKKYRNDSDDDKKKKHRDDSDDDREKSKKSSKSSRSKYHDDDSESDHKKRSSKGGRRRSASDDGDDSEESDSKRRHAPKKAASSSSADKGHARTVSHDPRVVEITPGGGRGGGGGGGSGEPFLAPAGHARTQRLSIHGGRPETLSIMAPGAHNGALVHHGGGLPPGSPLLEAYRGTYQSISPMPSPIRLPTDNLSDMSDLEPLEGVGVGVPGRFQDGDDDDDDIGPPGAVRAIAPRRSRPHRVTFYDPEADARAIGDEIKAQKHWKALVKILPSLSDDNIMHLRTEYKKHYKVNGKGINVAKHIKMKVPGNIGKAAYATALGRWESEANWSNFWYQSNSSRRELLIESLIGRSNWEIQKIKESFQDKRYDNSLENCMKAELKRDKFRHAVLLVLEERRQDELEKLNMARVNRDVDDLYKALVAKEGGETALIDIIVVRSDSHLKQVLVEFERKYKRNFAREMIKKSQNLVGETLAHILNGVINKPLRDAQLLRQAITETSKDRAELLVSRLVRMHWEPKHLKRVKEDYRLKYGSTLAQDIADGTKGEFGEFCIALCGGAVR